MAVRKVPPDQAAVCESRLAEAYRRIVRIHASLAVSDRDPAEVRDWALDQLADVIEYMESAQDLANRT